MKKPPVIHKGLRSTVHDGSRTECGLFETWYAEHQLARDFGPKRFALPTIDDQYIHKTWHGVTCKSCLRPRGETPGKLRPENELFDYDFGDHEVTDRAALVLEMFAEKVLDHKRVQADPALKELAQAASNALHEVYQAAGAKMLRRIEK